MKLIPSSMESLFHHWHQHLSSLLKLIGDSRASNSSNGTNQRLLANLFSARINDAMDDYEKRKTGIFIQLNFLQLVTGSIVPVTGLFHSSKFSVTAGLIMCLPFMTNAVVLLLNASRRYKSALFCYFIFYPVFTCFAYLNGINTGYELSFVLYGILSVFFLKDAGYMLFALHLSMISYFVLFILWKEYAYQLEPVNNLLYMISQALAIGYIFFALYLIKRENTGYQLKILATNKQLRETNKEMERQKNEISEKAKLLGKQTARLAESNCVKNKLFSIVSHDLKAPVFALRDMFRRVKDMDLSAETIKSMVPDILDDLNASSALIENLLQWSKHQMHDNSVQPQMLDLVQLVKQAIRSSHLQASAKKISIQVRTALPVYAWADRDMIGVVLRNLLSNAIKYSGERSTIIIGASESPYCSELYVQDFGKGISAEQIKKINDNSFYTTRGTRNEAGTGLGLMLCREFILKNDGCLMMESEPGKGSRFSFTLPLTPEVKKEDDNLTGESQLNGFHL